MKKISHKKLSSFVLLSACLAGLSNSASAVDGVILITQANAMAGNVTPGDAPGYPVTISQSGSYRLASNLAVPNKDAHAILLNAVSVSLDLNGFNIIGPCPRLFGVSTCSGLGIGVTTTDVADAGDVVIQNGTIKGMGADGVNLHSSVRLDKVKLLGNNGVGAILQRGSLVLNSEIADNYAGGLNVLGRSSVLGNVITNNGENNPGKPAGITTGPSGGIIVSDNSITDNTGLGINAAGNGLTAFGKNVITGNNAGLSQVSGGKSMGANICDPVACP